MLGAGQKRSRRPAPKQLLAADARGGVYFTVTGTGLFYANPQGEVTQYGEGITAANGVVRPRIAAAPASSP